MSFLRRLIMPLLAACLLLPLAGCRIEPPLNLPGRDDIDIRFGEVVLDLEVIWGLETENWRDDWWYGWDETDTGLWGELAYPEPSSYEVRLHYLGTAGPSGSPLSVMAHHLTETRLRTKLDYGFHNVLAWSNIDSSDGTQVLVVDEKDPANVYATTSLSTQLSSVADASSRTVLNNPEIFYSGFEQGIEITDDPADYDYYLPDQNIWVKQLNTCLYPMVYIYLVQVVIYNNNGRVTGVTDNCTASGLSAAVHLPTGNTSTNDVVVAFEMRLKRDLPARDGRHADILGGKLTTFGMCGMEGWARSRSRLYAGSRDDLANGLNLGLRFVNNTEAVVHFDITDQMRRQAHGGVITIEIDADDIDIPTRPGGGDGTPTGGFDPTIDPLDPEENIFDM